MIPTSEEKLQATLSNNKELFSSNPTYIFKKNDLGIVNLKWQHEGQILNTQCIISKKNGIIYDKFLYFIHFPIEEKIQMQVFPTIRSYTDSIPPDLNGPISYTWSVTDEAYNYFNIRVWYYNIICNVYGEKVMGIKSINDKSLNAYSDYALGFSSDAKVIEFSFSSGFDGHLNFGWAWTHKIGLGAQISFF
ncbi:MAG: hypothetical protein PHR65_03060 [Syntrophomonadaceae bacterium]|nr:hypothetical protein [Syntrophomonadaceae bacterium]